MEKLAILLLLSAAIALGDANLTLLLGLEPLLKTEVEQTPPVEAQVAAVQEGTKESSCPSDWHPYGSRCLKFVSIQQSWADSEQNCLALGGNLASVHNLLEYRFMQALTKDTNGHLPDTWVGGFDAVKEGLWMWSDGSRFDYTHWNTGEPNNAGEGEDCLQMNAASEKLWFDVPCEWKFASLCARRMFARKCHSHFTSRGQLSTLQYSNQDPSLTAAHQHDK